MTETSKEEAFTYRAATANDATDILAILEEVAPEVPVLLDTPERIDAIKTVIIQSYQSGESWVACDAAGAIVGFALAKLAAFAFDQELQLIKQLRVVVAKGFDKIRERQRGRGSSRQ